MTKNTTLNVRITEDEYTSLKAFADFHGQTMTSLVLMNIRTMMEDWEDIRDAEDVLRRNEPKTLWSEIKKEVGL